MQHNSGNVSQDCQFKTVVDEHMQLICTAH